MTADTDNFSLPQSRPVPAGRHIEHRKLLLPGGYETDVYIHPPAAGSRPRLPVLYMHGIQSHPGWFTGSAVNLAERGHTVYQVTRRGSGRNMCHRGHVEATRSLLGDLEAARRFVLEDASANFVKKVEKVKKLHLMGVSWGGKLAALYATWPGVCESLASLTLIAPGIAPRVKGSLGMKLAVAWALLVNPRKYFDIPLNEVELFTDNPAMRQYLRDDEYRLHRATARFLYVDHRLNRMLSRCGRGSLKVPTTLLLASHDRIIDNAATRAVVEHLTDGRAAVMELAGCHTLEFEGNPNPLFEALSAAVAQ